MALNSFKRNRLTPLRFKGLTAEKQKLSRTVSNSELVKCKTSGNSTFDGWVGVLAKPVKLVECGLVLLDGRDVTWAGVVETQKIVSLFGRGGSIPA